MQPVDQLILITVACRKEQFFRNGKHANFYWGDRKKQVTGVGRGIIKKGLHQNWGFNLMVNLASLDEICWNLNVLTIKPRLLDEYCI